jgi:hypothetical protein
MDQAVKTIGPQAPDARQAIGWILVAVILGEAIWNLIVSVMNNLVVPWLGDVMGSSSGLPTSFTQRPYDYPALFVSVLEFCIAGMVAATLNHFFQRKREGRAKLAKGSVSIAAAEPARMIPQAAPPAMAPAAAPVTPLNFADKPVPVTPAVPAEVVPIVAAVPAPVEAPASVAPKPQPPAKKAAPPQPQKAKPVYYNIVGEPMPSDED